MAKTISAIPDELAAVTGADLVEVSEKTGTDTYATRKWAPGSMANQNADQPVQTALSADPPDPDPGRAVEWLSDGTQSGDAGDKMMKINVGGTVKTITVIDYSAQ